MRKSTDVASCAQLLVFVSYIYLRDIKKEFLFCNNLEATTRSVDIMEKINTFFNSGKLPWKYVFRICIVSISKLSGNHVDVKKKGSHDQSLRNTNFLGGIACFACHHW